MEDANTSGEGIKISKINSAGLINLRIHNLWNDTHVDARKGRFLSWNIDLDRIWCELGGDIKEKVMVKVKGKEEKEEKVSPEWAKLKELNETIKKFAPLSNGKSKEGFSDASNTEEKKRSEQYDALLAKEMFLRRIQNKYGKGTAYIDDADDYMNG